MNRLLDSVIKAHGGSMHWAGFTDLVTDVDLTGQLFQQPGWSPVLKQTRLLIALRSQRSILLLPEGHGTVVLGPGRVSHLDGTGEEVESKSDPAARISQLQSEFGWNTLSSAYFLINVVRRSVMAPFLYASAGFMTEEITPWNENGEVWNVLKVTFPEGADVPSRVQYAYYGPDGLLRCLRNRVTLLGGLDLLEYVSSYSDVNGVQIPMSREVFACDRAGNKLGDQPLGRLELREAFLTD